MAPFMKTALELRLKGVTNDRDDPSVIIFWFYFIEEFINDMYLSRLI
jgi:hypothetical protein